MKKITSILTALSILLTLCVGFNTSAQKPGNDKPKDKSNGEDLLTMSLRKNWDKVPERMKAALAPEAKAGWEKFTPWQREKLKAKLREIMRSDAVQQAEPGNEGSSAGEESTLSFVDSAGNHRQMKATRHDASIGPRRRASTEGRTNNRAATRRAKAPWQESWASPGSVVPIVESGKLHHARRTPLRNSTTAIAPQAGCNKGPEQFVRTFYQAALARPPHADELSYWMSTFAQAQSQGTLLASAQSLGNTLFQSSEYAARGRSNGQFVDDCYRAFLQRAPDPGGLQFWTTQADANGQPAVLQAFVVCGEFSDDVAALCNVATFDGDQDGLPDNFENAVGDNFTPYYHVSQYETDNYSTFENFVPQTVKDRFGQNPVSHFRVVPLNGGNGPVRWNYISGRWESFLRIEYFTLWDHDSGLVGDVCGLAPGEDVLQGVNAHELDNERSALLVSAPAVWNGSGYAINLDPSAYSSLSIYTAAHEFTATSHSQYQDFPQSPRAAGNRFELWQSLYKHSTYTFNPDFLPLLQGWTIAAILIVVETWLLTRTCNGYVDDFFIELFGDDAYGWSCTEWWTVFISLSYYLVVLFFTCAVERFFEQGAALANIRINIGEPRVTGASGNPINGSEFIQDDSEHALRLYNKLIQPLQFESLFP